MELTNSQKLQLVIMMYERNNKSYWKDLCDADKFHYYHMNVQKACNNASEQGVTEICKIGDNCKLTLYGDRNEIVDPINVVSELDYKTLKYKYKFTFISDEDIKNSPSDAAAKILKYIISNSRADASDTARNLNIYKLDYCTWKVYMDANISTRTGRLFFILVATYTSGKKIYLKVEI